MKGYGAANLSYGIPFTPETPTNIGSSSKQFTGFPIALHLTSVAGRYFSEELDTFYDLSVEGGTLVIRHRRFGPVALTYTSGDSFSGTLPVSSLVFSRDAEGKVTGFEAGNGRARGIVFKKVSH